MQLQKPMMPGYALNQYLLVLSPHEELRNRIVDIKKQFREKFQATMATASRPHLTLVTFITWALNEEKIVRRFQHTAMAATPFKVELKDFGSFPSHTVYIQVTTKGPVQELVRQLKGAQKLMKADPDHDPHFIHDPHITIARKLMPWQYEKAWNEYSNTHFTGRFVADSMLLLKRSLNGGPYQIVQRMDFRNMPVATRQGDLFV